MEDKWLWSASSDGSFTVKAAKSILQSDQVSDNRFVLHWCKWVPAKCNIHAWRLEMDRIPTGDALKKGMFFSSKFIVVYVTVPTKPPSMSLSAVMLPLTFGMGFGEKERRGSGYYDNCLLELMESQE
ncbi:uncharacterized protein LOC118485086 [Helianthus annuus]|uniref:uncharacterized protein LOC118485086 n=1 Tax=Helianthus annuus TaxID=4232 RepID=UPI001652DCFC|nr:uncharacterized protein LOC118485086 [Helianthus annuus]